MNRQSLEKMKLDKRLAGRRGWVSNNDLALEAEKLPDASAKVAEKTEAAEAGESDTSSLGSDPQMPSGSDPV
jgi:hypothetical protein